MNKMNEEETAEDNQRVSAIVNEFFCNVIPNLDLTQYIDPLINTENIDNLVLNKR